MKLRKTTILEALQKALEAKTRTPPELVKPHDSLLLLAEREGRIATVTLQVSEEQIRELLSQNQTGTISEEELSSLTVELFDPEVHDLLGKSTVGELGELFILEGGVPFTSRTRSQEGREGTSKSAKPPSGMAYVDQLPEEVQSQLSVDSWLV